LLAILPVTGSQPEERAFSRHDRESDGSGLPRLQALQARPAFVRRSELQYVARICRLIEQAEEIPSLTELAEVAGLSPGYFHRIFKAVTGVTPKEYTVAHRADKVRGQLGSLKPLMTPGSILAVAARCSG
jgi:AraC family transcriptional regulator of adaptative response/methylated-DNA-[protein]-cysteine methyltransferase